MGDKSAGQKQKPHKVAHCRLSPAYYIFVTITSPSKIANMIGYQNLIIQASIHCQEGCWVPLISLYGSWHSLNVYQEVVYM